MAKPNTIIQGRPTRPQVEKLMTRWGDIKRGDSITKKEIADVIGEEADSSRWRGVVNAWRGRILRERGIMLAAVSGVGFRATLPDEQVRVGAGKIRCAARMVYRGAAIVERVPPNELGEEARRQREFVLTRSRAALDSVRATSREIELALPRANR